jgi:hypothetical protein
MIFATIASPKPEPSNSRMLPTRRNGWNTESRNSGAYQMPLSVT